MRINFSKIHLVPFLVLEISIFSIYLSYSSFLFSYLQFQIKMFYSRCSKKRFAYFIDRIKSYHRLISRWCKLPFIFCETMRNAYKGIQFKGGARDSSKYRFIRQLFEGTTSFAVGLWEKMSLEFDIFVTSIHVKYMRGKFQYLSGQVITSESLV